MVNLFAVRFIFCAITEYNSLGQTVSTTDAKGNTTTYEYDKLGRNIKVTAPFNGTTTTSTKTYYDGNGNVTKTAQQITSSTWKTTENTYDNMNRLETTRTGGGAYTQYEYDSVGNVTKTATGLDEPIDMSKADINGDYELVTYSYDFKNALTESHDALGQRETYRTDLFGNVKSKTDRNGNIITAAYNPYGNILVQTVTQPNGTEETITNTYDILGNIKTMTDSTGVTSYEYDSFSRLTTESKGDIIKTYSYDAADNRTAFSLAKNGTTVMDTSYTYDKRNLLTKVTNGSRTTSYTYDANGNLLTDTTGADTTTYTYNNANLATKVSNGLQSFQYNYDLEGKIKNCLENINGSSYFDYYFYDNMGRLTSEETRAALKDYTYDKYGNITSVKNSAVGTTTTRTYDKNNRLMTETDGTVQTEYCYDFNGNMISKKINSGAAAIYSYNGLNRLVSVKENGLTSSYTYDGTGLRQSKTVNGTTTNHIWDGTNIVAETNGASITNKYYRGANGLIYANLNGTETKYLKDGHGNVTGLANMSGTTLNKFYCYDAFGAEKDIDTNDTNPSRYCGEYYDNEIDKIYLRARYYSPIQGRFITEDPIKDGLNWYAYCNGDPVNAWDTMGLEDVVVSGGKYTNEIE